MSENRDDIGRRFGIARKSAALDILILASGMNLRSIRCRNRPISIGPLFRQ